jgi:uncharacterized protein (TIGR02145 family)
MKKIRFFKKICLLIILVNLLTTRISAQNQEFETITIGNQIWMTDQSATIKLSNSVLEIDPVDWKQLSEKFPVTAFGFVNFLCISGNHVECPTGWRIPKKSDWDALINYLGGEEIAGKKMKTFSLSTEDGENYMQPIYEGHNESGFSSELSMHLDSDGYFTDAEPCACYWSSSTSEDKQPYALYLTSLNNSAYLSESAVGTGCSVVCIKER